MKNITLTAERLKLAIVKTDALTPLMVSSSPSYDMSLQQIFPYHTKLTMEQGAELSGLLSNGQKYENSDDKFYPSFALMMNFKGGGPLGGKVLWLSEAAMNLLQRHDDLYEIDLIDHTTPAQWKD